MTEKALPAALSARRLPAWPLLLELCKVRITSAVLITVTVGYLLRGSGFGWSLLPVLSGAFLLACGSFALNQWQERELDRRMPRTRGRPLPSGRIAPGQVLAIALALLALGSLLLLPAAPAALGLGWLTVFWYNGVYVFLKRHSALAVVPGSLVGALPPMMGWVAAGGGLAEPRILGLALLLFVWQIPHFWLLLFLFGDQYERAGLPSLTARYSTRRLALATYAGFAATAATALVVALPGLVAHHAAAWPPAALAALWLVWRGRDLLREDTQQISFRGAFRDINLFTLALLTIFTIDSLLA